MKHHLLPPFLLFSTALLLLPLCSAKGIYVVDPSQHPRGNPPNGLPVSNVLWLGARSAIYLGDIAENGTYWLLSTGHGGLPANMSVTIGTSSYALGESHDIANVYPDQANAGATGNADLRLVQIITPHSPGGLPTLHITPTAPTAGTLMTLLGLGDGHQLWAEAPITGPIPGQPNFHNLIVPGYPYQTRSFTTNINLTNPSNPPSYGHAATGDSGGGALYYDTFADEWYIAGTLIAINSWGSSSNRSVYTANLHHYRDQIYDIAFAANPIPEPSSLLLLLPAALYFLRHRLTGSRHL